MPWEKGHPILRPEGPRELARLILLARTEVLSDVDGHLKKHSNFREVCLERWLQRRRCRPGLKSWASDGGPLRDRGARIFSPGRSGGGAPGRGPIDSRWTRD